MQKDEHLECHGGYERIPPATASAGRGEAHSTATHAVAKHKLPRYHRFARYDVSNQDSFLSRDRTHLYGVLASYRGRVAHVAR